MSGADAYVCDQYHGFASNDWDKKTLTGVFSPSSVINDHTFVSENGNSCWSPMFPNA